MTTKDLIARHNELARETGAAELTDWKKSKAELEARIAGLGEPTADPLDMGADDEPDGASEPVSAPEPKASVAAVVAEVLADASLNYEQVAAIVRERVPGAATSARSVASIALRLRKGGAVIPARLPKAKA